MKSFYQYLAESAREYRYRVKSVIPMDSQFIDILKKTLFKYDILNVSEPKKTPFQKNPLDFRSFENAEVWILDITTSVPASSYVLATELRGALKVTDSSLMVRGENEPREIEARALEEIHKDEAQKAKLDDPTYADEPQPKEVAYGDAYNKKFLNYLAQIKSDAQDVHVPAIEEIKKTNKFNWLNKLDDTVAPDFNAGIDTVKPVHSNSKKPGAKNKKPNLTGNYDNYDENVRKES